MLYTYHYNASGVTETGQGFNHGLYITDLPIVNADAYYRLRSELFRLGKFQPGTEINIHSLTLLHKSDGKQIMP